MYKINTKILVCVGSLLLCIFGEAEERVSIEACGYLWKVYGHAKIDGNILTVDVPIGKETECGGASTVIDLTPFRGSAVRGFIRASGKDLGRPLQQWNGIKFMLHYKNDQGMDVWPDTGRREGSFADETLRVEAELKDVSATSAELTLGLASAAGRVVFDLSTLKFTKVRPFDPSRRVNLDYKVGYPERLMRRGQLRGVMLPSPFLIKEDDFRTLHDWGAKLVRYQINREWNVCNGNSNADEYDEYIGAVIKDLYMILDWARKYDILVVIDLHGVPGAKSNSRDMNLFYEERYLKHFIRTWCRLAEHFRGNTQIYGYDLINEPWQNVDGAPYSYWDCQRMAAEAIRKIDPETPIIVESNVCAQPKTFAYLSPLAMDNVIYEVHMYEPIEFTHQNVIVPQPSVSYPDHTKGWNLAGLEKILQPVIEFQKRHNARIYVGEFSAVCWAEGADHYISDCIEVFRKYGWDWTYHAFREWEGWSVEHTGTCVWEGKDSQRNGTQRTSFKPSADNPRKRALLKGFGR